VTRSIWRGRIGEPKTEASCASVPVIPRLATFLDAHRKRLGNPISGAIFPNGKGNPLDLDSLCTREMKPVLKKAEIEWLGWHAFRRGLASNLKRLGVDDLVIQRLLRHSDVSTTRRCYILISDDQAEGAMQQLSRTLKCAQVVPNPETGEAQVTVQ